MDRIDTQHLQSLTIPQLLRWRVESTGDKVALREKEFGRWNSYTWNDYYHLVRKTGLGLQKLGLKKGDAIALIGDNIPEMLFTAIGAQAVGGVSAAIYQTTMPEEIAQLLAYMNVSMVFCDNQEQVDKIVEIRERVPGVKHVIYEDPRGMRGYRSDDWFVFIDDLYRLGDDVHAENPDLYESLVDQGTADQVCHLCLTSGTTGLSKGTMLTHKNFISMGLQLTDADPLADTDEYLSFLPFAWIGEQMNSFGVAMATGITINFPESVETAMEDLKEIGPHFMFGAPRIYETIRSQIWLKIDESYWLTTLIGGFSWFFKKSTVGISMRAVSDDQFASMSVGISVPRVFGLAWATAGLSAAAAGVIIGNITGLNFETLQAFGITVFPVVILGGLDSILGAVVAGIIMGIIQQFASGYLDGNWGLNGTAEVLPYIILLIILLFKPHGLFGIHEIERV